MLEGFADYVALRDTSLPDSVTLGRAIAAAERGEAPQSLPTAADFDSRGRDLQARYEEAWLACRIIAERRGERVLTAIYRAAARGRSLAEALEGAELDAVSVAKSVQERLRFLVR